MRWVYKDELIKENINLELQINEEIMSLEASEPRRLAHEECETGVVSETLSPITNVIPKSEFTWDEVSQFNVRDLSAEEEVSQNWESPD